MRIQDFITRRRFAWATVFTLGCYGLILLWGGIATARNAVEQFHCDEALRRIFARIESERTKDAANAWGHPEMLTGCAAFARLHLLTESGF